MNTLLALALAVAADPADRAPVLRDVIRLTNDERAKLKLPPLAEQAVLSKVAQGHSDNMAAQKKMAHELDGKAPADRVKAAGYKFQHVAENVAEGQPTAAAVLAAWMASPGHKANILDANVTEIGVGLAHDADGRPYYTQVFGRPLTAVANTAADPAAVATARKAAADAIAKLINEERTKAGLPSFKVHATLTEVAGRHAAGMAKEASFKVAFKPYEEAEKAGYKFATAAEVMSAGTDEAKKVLDGWLTGDNRNALLGDAVDVGVGVGYAADGTAYVAVLLAKPR